MYKNNSGLPKPLNAGCWAGVGPKVGTLVAAEEANGLYNVDVPPAPSPVVPVPKPVKVDCGFGANRVDVAPNGGAACCC